MASAAQRELLRSEETSESSTSEEDTQVRLYLLLLLLSCTRGLGLFNLCGLKAKHFSEFVRIISLEFLDHSE